MGALILNVQYFSLSYVDFLHQPPKFRSCDNFKLQCTMDDSQSPVDIEIDDDVDINEQVSEQELESHDSYSQEMHLELDDDVEIVEEREVQEEIAEPEPRIGSNEEENGIEEATTNDEVDEVLTLDENVENIESDMEDDKLKSDSIEEVSPEPNGTDYNEEGEGEEADSGEEKEGEEREEIEEGENEEELVVEKEGTDRTYREDFEEDEAEASGAESGPINETNEYSDVEENENLEEELDAEEEREKEENEGEDEEERDVSDDPQGNDPEYKEDPHEEHDYNQINEPSNPNSPSLSKEDYATLVNEDNRIVTKDEDQPTVPIIIDVADTEFLLVPFKAENSSIDVSLLVPLFDSSSVLELPIEEFFGLMRHNEDLNEIYNFSVDEELVLLFPQFDGLHLTEDNVYSREVTFNDFLSTFERLAENTVSEKPLSMACTLTSQTRFITKFNGLAELIREKKGFESIMKHSPEKRPAESPTSAKKRQRLSID